MGNLGKWHPGGIRGVRRCGPCAGKIPVSKIKGCLFAEAFALLNTPYKPRSDFAKNLNQLQDLVV